MKVKTLNKTKSKNSEFIIKDEIFGITPNEGVILRVLKWQLANKQQGDHKVKSRSEVKSTTAKMYRQKGGGRARHGASSVVQFRGGGVVHGPISRSHSHKLPKKIRVFPSPQTVSLTVIGGVQRIASLDPEEIKVYINFNDWSSQIQFYEPNVKLPNGLLDWKDISPKSLEIAVAREIR